jgi:hypothetical protein
MQSILLLHAYLVVLMCYVHALLISYFIEILSMVVIHDQTIKIATKLSNESFV